MTIEKKPREEQVRQDQDDDLDPTITEWQGFKVGDEVRALEDNEDYGYFAGDQGKVVGFGTIPAATDPKTIAIRRQFGQPVEGRTFMMVEFEGMDPMEVFPDDVEKM